jgi:beta-N-acetylhexosaminidase
MLAFAGTSLPHAMAERLSSAPAAGITLFRYHNVETPAQVLELTSAVQRAAASFSPDGGPVLVAADQEGGQFLALGDGTTPFPGAMALGAAGDVDLAERVALATGRELLALGVNTAYVPVCDLASNPANVALGIRAFGDDPVTVGAFAASTVRGLRAAGVAAGAKHFPGLGEASTDSHYGLPVVGHSRARLEQVELPPFRAAIGAGADLVMSAHVALPAITGDPSLPGTLAREVMHDLVRDGLAFGGLTITDALDMEALPQGAAQAVDVVAALRAGVDLLLCAPDPARLARIEEAAVHAQRRRLFDGDELRASAARLAALRMRLGAVEAPPLEVVGSEAHRALALEAAARALTLVRDDLGQLPLRLGPGSRLLAVMPRPRELTPADTSASVPPGLAAVLRRRWPTVEEVVTSHPPTDDEIAGVVARVAAAEAVVIGTIAASLDPAQARLAAAVLEAGHATGKPVVTVALRTPWDLGSYPRARIHVATYGLLPPSLEALADALVGDRPFLGRLPVDVPGVAPRGHGLTGVAA